eukprot:2933212-Pleurochrysis_carterae.AAC.2
MAACEADTCVPRSRRLGVLECVRIPVKSGCFEWPSLHLKDAKRSACKLSSARVQALACSTQAQMRA